MILATFPGSSTMRIPATLNFRHRLVVLRSSIVNQRSSIIGALLLLALALDGSVVELHGTDKAWKAGLAAVDITPTEPIWLAGYGARTKPSQGVIAPIFAKALVLEDPRGSRLVIIGSDILGFTRALSDPIAQQLEKKWK